MKPIQLNFKPSMIFSALFTLMGSTTCCIVMLLTMPSQIKLILILMIIISAVYAVLKHGLLSLPSSYITLKVNSKNQLQLIRKDGKTLEVKVEKDSTVTPYLTVLNSRVEGASWLQGLFGHALIIFPDAINAESYRQFRVWLRWANQRNNKS